VPENQPAYYPISRNTQKPNQKFKLHFHFFIFKADSFHRKTLKHMKLLLECQMLECQNDARGF
jgi:hypothetical protein